MPDTYTKSGRVSSYGFACGQVESKVVAGGRYSGRMNQTYVEMYQEHTAFHVKKFVNGNRTQWQVFETLGEARKAYNAIRS